jgi:hypothetical protein
MINFTYNDKRRRQELLNKTNWDYLTSLEVRELDYLQKKMLEWRKEKSPSFRKQNIQKL